MVKHKIACSFLSLLLAASVVPVAAFADADESTASDVMFDSSVSSLNDIAADEPLKLPELQPAVPDEPLALEEPVQQPEQAEQPEAAAAPLPAPTEMTVPGENSWRFDNGNSTTDGLGEGPLSLEERLASSSGPAGWFQYSQGYFTGQPTFKGIDVSYHQGIIDWQAVKNAGVDFVIIRCGYGDDYRSQDDAMWLRNVQGARAVGIPFGVYLYSYAKQADTWNASNPQSAQSEAEHVLRCLREAGLSPEQVALPVYYDMEDDSMGTDYAGMAKRFCDIVGGSGYKVGVYASKNWWESKLTDGYFNGVTRWVAQFNSHAGLQYSRFNKDNDIWQFSSSGRISGISGNVDMNYTNRSLGAIAPGEKIVADGMYAIKSSLDPNKAVDIAGGSKMMMANVQLFDANNTEAQRFRLNYSGGFYTVINVGSGLALDVAGGSVHNGGNIWQYPLNDSDAQKWRIDRNNDGTFVFVSKKSGLVLDLLGGSIENGTNVQQFASNGTLAQRFYLEDMEVQPGSQTLANGTYAISSRLDVNKLIDVENASVLSGANIHLYHRNNSVAQVFNLTFKDGYYTIINPNSGKALDVAGGSYYSGANVQQYTPNGTDAQKWRIDRNVDGTFTLISKKTGYVLDVSAANTENGTNIQQYKPNGTKAQKFTFQMMIRDEVQGASALPYNSPAEAVVLMDESDEPVDARTEE